jgi:hypothetical protein
MIVRRQDLWKLWVYIAVLGATIFALNLAGFGIR